MTWGEQNTLGEAFEQMDLSLENGVNFWDTAESIELLKLKHMVNRNYYWKLDAKQKKKRYNTSIQSGWPSRKYMRNGENSFTGKNLEMLFTEV